LDGISTKAKVAIILGGVLIIIIGIIFFINANKKPATAPDQSPVSSEDLISVEASLETGQTLEPDLSPEPASSDQINYISPTTSKTSVGVRTPVPADANGVRRYTVKVSPAPDAGYFDWTKNLKNEEYTVVDLSQSKFAKQSPCEFIGFENSWSNIVEKMSCDAVNFLAGRVTEALNQLDCAFQTSAIKSNYSPNVTSKLEDGQCLILDR
jgi:hypothetical protein